ncbi:MAG: AMP-binding protein [Brachymonas sp.]
MSPLLHATLWPAMQAQAPGRGDSPALRFEGQQTSYAQLAAQACGIAAALCARGVQRGDRVAWLGLNHPLQIALLLACAGIGAIAMPLNYRLAKPELARMLNDASPSLLLHDLAWQDMAQTLGTSHTIQTQTFEALLREGGALPAVDMARGRSEDAVLLVYTSGTSGLPKGAVHTQRNLCQNMQLVGTNAALIAADLIATVLPLFHVGGLCIQTLPALGWALV